MLMTAARLMLGLFVLLNTQIGFGATIQRVNSEGTVLIVTLAPDEPFKSGDLVFIGTGDRFRSTGFVSIEKNNQVYVKANQPITHLSPGDEITLSHDISWIRRSTDYRPNILGKVASISKQLVYVTIDETFLPVFGMDETIDLQIEESLETVAGTVRAYRQNGLWFKVPVSIEKLSVGSKVLLIQKKDENAPTHARADTSHANQMITGLGLMIFNAGGDSSATYTGAAAEVLYAHHFRVARLWTLPVMVGIGYERTSSTIGSTTYVMTAPSIQFKTGASYRLNDAFSVGPILGYGMGLSGTISASGGDNSQTVSDVHRNATVFGGGFSYHSSRTFSYGLDIGLISGQISAPDSTGGTTSSSISGHQELFTMRFDL